MRTFELMRSWQRHVFTGEWRATDCPKNGHASIQGCTARHSRFSTSSRTGVFNVVAGFGFDEVVMDEWVRLDFDFRTFEKGSSREI